MQPQSSTPAAPQNGHAKRTKLALFITLGVIAAILIVVAILLFLLKPFTPSSPAPVIRPAATIAGKPYLYACSMFTHDDVTNIFTVTEKDKFIVATTDAFSTNNQPVDILKLLGKDTYGSSCTYNFDVADASPEARQKSKKVDIYAVQYKDAATAQKTYEQYKAEITSPKTLPSFKAGYAYDDKDEDTGKNFLNASVLRGNLEIIITTSTDFGFDTNQQVAAIDNLYKRAFQRIDDGQAKKMPDFTGIAAINGNSVADVCTHLNTTELGSTLNGLEFRPIDIRGTQNLTQLTDSSQPLKSLESACSYNFRTAQDAKDPANAELSYLDRYGHLLTVSKRVFSSNQDAKQALDATKRTLQSPAQNGGSRGDYAEVTIGEGGARIINENSANKVSTYSYYVLDKNNLYRFAITSNTIAKKSFTSKGVTVTDEFIVKIFEQARR